MKRIATLKKNYEFKNVIQKGEYYVGKQIIIYIAKTSLPRNRVGIAIGTKICYAVKRNRLKRLIRENYRLIQSSLLQGYNIVFLWNKKESYQDADFFLIQKDMKKIFQKAQIMKEGPSL